MKTTVHKTVLLKKTVDLVNPTSGKYIDLTLGGGGHLLEIAAKIKSGKLLGIDQDQKAISNFENRILNEGWIRNSENLYSKEGIEILLYCGNFEKLTEIAKRLGFEQVQGIVADLGLSSDQLDDATRGFSFKHEGPLDMRMNESLNVKASDLLKFLSEKELTQIFFESDEPNARKIARAIVNSRKDKKIETTLHLTNIISSAVGFSKNLQQKQITHNPTVGDYWVKPAMRVFQALRIAVNSELNSLQVLLPQALEILAPGKVACFISFHSGEDKIIKSFIKENEKLGRIENLTKTPILPEESELELNMRARSAKLRAFRKTAHEK